jgi:uncharacterized protein (TIGR02996 family)
MDTAEALLQAIIAAPDDDEPRFVYADWLEEHGQRERGEFIRLNCQQLRKWKRRVSDRKDPDNVRMFDLEDQHHEAWLGEMPQLSGVRWWCLWRGFPSFYLDNYNALRRNAKRIWAVAPVERVDFNSLSLAGARALANSPYLSRLRVLGFDWVGRAGLPALRALLESPQLVHLRNLVAFSCGLGDEGAKAIAECPCLTGLEVAHLDCNEIRDQGGRAIACSPNLPKLIHLDISRNRYSKRVARALEKRFPGST